MKIKKNLINILLIFVALFAILSLKVFAETPAIEESSEDNFSGTRYFTIYSDLSNLKNYIIDGRSGLEYVIRSKNKYGINVDILSDNYNLKLDCSFNFKSFEDYKKKINYLLTYDATIINEEGTYIEGFSTRELANYLKNELQTANLYVSDTDTIELFSSGESKIVFSDSTEYVAENEKIKNQKNKDVELLLSKLNIDTVYNKADKSFTRKIDFEIETESDSLLNSMKKSFIKRCEKEKVEYVNNEVESFSVEFTRNTEQELAKTTMMLLNTGESIRNFRKIWWWQ